MADTVAGAAPTAGGAGAAGTVLIRYFAAAEEAAGVAEESVPVADGATLADLLEQASARHPGLADALPACSYLVATVSGRPTTPVPAGAVVDVLPPFAGG